jgi:hypothetical protein
MLASFVVIAGAWPVTQARKGNKPWSAAIAALRLEIPLPPRQTPPLFTPPVSNTSVPLPPNLRLDKPELTAMIINPAAPSLIINVLHTVARDVKADSVLWDVDREDKSLDSLPIYQVKYDWIRTDQSGGPTDLMNLADKNIAKTGHRIFGFVSIACPNCSHNKAYWVFWVYGQEGWYTEIPNGQYPDLKKLSDQIIPGIRQVGISVLSLIIPEVSRVPIRELH